MTSRTINRNAYIVSRDGMNQEEADYLHASTQRIPVGPISYTPCKFLGAVHVCVGVGVHACQVAEGGVIRTG